VLIRKLADAFRKITARGNKRLTLVMGVITGTDTCLWRWAPTSMPMPI